ncbi:GGDEF domain-containing protein [Shewanella sp. AS1]|uniref:GGDEF domain-containing protein n=1 Tax=Shewanella sp. AS1 TaxID=2907626 RepID=UPI001F40108D|nr:GGDEF domain-containing protein [Shewanella sp. AS1]MCE9679424.1 GGDEF domain-containing protein [Shewanella sp. AS1]
MTKEINMAKDVSVDSLLKQADQVKSSDPEAFSLLLDSLEQQPINRQQALYLQYLQAYELTYQGNNAQSIEIFNEIISSQADEQLKFKANQTLINIYAISQNWSLGLSHLSKNFKLLESIKDPELIQNGLAIAAIFYNQIEQYELGLSYANKLKQAATSPRNSCLANGLVIEALLSLNQLDVESPSLETAINSCDDEVIMQSFIHSYIATKYLKDGQLDKVFEQLLPRLNVIENTHYPGLIVEVYATLSKAYQGQGQTSDALDYANKINKLANGLGNTQATVTAYEILYQDAQDRGDYRQALNYHIKYTQADRAYLDDIKTKHLAFQLAEHQTAEQQNRIALLDRQNNLLLTEQQLAKAEAENNRLFIILLCAVITLLVFWGYKSWTVQRSLKQLAEYDSLTQILNRGHFTQVTQSALNYCENTKTSLSYILFDLDYFKQINDQYGHAWGDWVLQQVAQVCQAHGRKNDLFARIGGEEFCIALPGSDINTAIRLAEACQKAMAQIKDSSKETDLVVTASFGITDTQLSGYKLEKLMHDADCAMYQSKHNGRNQISVFNPDKHATCSASGRLLTQ